VEQKKHEIAALCVLLFTVLVLCSLLSFHASDHTLFNASSIDAQPLNWVGVFGAHVAWLLFFLVGLGAYGVPLAGIWLSWSLLRGTFSPSADGVKITGLGLMVLSLVALGHLQGPLCLHFGQEILVGGYVGSMVGHGLVLAFRPVGTRIFLIGVLAIALTLATPFSPARLWKWVGRMLAAGWKGAVALPGGVRKPWKPRNGSNSGGSSSIIKEGISKIRKSVPRVELLPAPSPSSEASAKPPTPKKRPASASRTVEKSGGYELPSLDLLDTLEEGKRRPERKLLEENARVLQEKLADFGVQGEVADIGPGPVVTMYEYVPAPGIKISRVVSLSNDLSMALRAMSIRVVAPIPGKAAIGIEIPNDHRELVSIKSILDSAAYSTAPHLLTIALGKDISGQPVVANLARMPHLLIAGATGTGKSVGINAIVTSLLYRNTPESLRLLLIDPKRIELSSYEGVPHLLHPVVTDAKLATRALQWAVKEMELRYKLLADKNVRSIESYNKTLAREKGKEGSAAEEAREDSLPHHHLPYIVVIIDELADLMMVASREVEESITRLAQMARAAGIHLMLATQRPSVDVLTGIIKANIPTRISFQVSSRVDSRTILDNMGAENLLGSGDMLFLPPGTAKLQRIHGAFISDSEVQRVTEFWRARQPEEDVLADRVDFESPSSSPDLDEEEMDAKYDEAVQLVLEMRQASISMIQRRLRVGYNRAARMIEIMEQQGIVGPSDGTSRPREVLVPDRTS